MPDKLNIVEGQFREADPARDTIDETGVLDALHRNEDGDAELFITQNRDRLRYDHQAGRWYIFHEHHWTLDRLDEATASVRGVVDVYADEAQRQAWLKLKAERAGDSQTAKRHTALEKQLLKRVRELHTAYRKKNVLILSRAGQDSLGIAGDAWDPDPWMLGVSNGVVDLRTGEHRPSDPGDHIRAHAPTEWKELETPAHAWERTLSEIFPDPEIPAYLHRLFGYALTGQCTEHVFPFACGRGRNGKGTIFETIHHVLGDMLSGPIEAEMLLSQKYSRASGTPASDILYLRGKRIVWASETGQGRSLNAGKVKWLTGGDTLTGRQPYAVDPVSFRPSHTLFLLTNHLPHASADDYALWHRIHRILFTMSFVSEPATDNERKADQELPARLQEEAPGILAWLVRGALEYQRTGLQPPEAVRAATLEYRQDEDIIGHFLQDRCIEGASYKVRSAELYEAYQGWCKANGHHAMTGTRFGKEMRQRLDWAKEGSIFYLGITLTGD